MASIILTGGGTAGHVMPNVALIPYLKQQFSDIYYIGSINGMEKEIIKKQNIPYFEIPTAKLIRSINLKNFSIPFKVISGIKKAGKIIEEIRPSVIFSKGGYVALPTVIAGKMKKVPVISHESDYTLGLSNKITAKFCKKVLTAFPETASSIKNGEYIGSPIRQFNLKKPTIADYAFFGFASEKPTLLVTGGSQGAKILNQTLWLSLPELLAKFNVLHICGKGNLNNEIKFNGYYQTEFMHDIDKAFSIADVCISRGGAGALFELMNMQLPSVIVPLPKGVSRGDQVLNANYFYKLGLINLLPQEQLTKDSLIANVNSAYSNRHSLKKTFKEHPVNDKSKAIANILADYIRH